MCPTPAKKKKAQQNPDKCDNCQEKNQAIETDSEVTQMLADQRLKI